MSHLSPAYSVIRTTVATYTGRAGPALRRFSTSSHQVPVVCGGGQTETHNIIYSGTVPGPTADVTSFGHKHLISPVQTLTPKQIHAYRYKKYSFNKFYADKKKGHKFDVDESMESLLGPTPTDTNTFIFISEKNIIIASQIAHCLASPGSDMVMPGKKEGEYWVQVVLPSHMVRVMTGGTTTLSPLPGSSVGSVAIVTLKVVQVGLETAIIHLKSAKDIGPQLAIPKSTVNPNHE
jgi:hypothetical protein